jgi:hypothetical protein
MLFVVGVPEYFLHEWASASTLSNKHYDFDHHGVGIFEPVPQCELPPGQPYAMTYAVDFLKLVSFFLVFGGIADRLTPTIQVPWWKRLLFVVMVVYQFAMIPLTMFSTVYHFFADMGPFDTYWHAYECFGAMWTSGPWWFNSLLFLSKEFMEEGSFGCRLTESAVFIDSEASIDVSPLDQAFLESMNLKETLLQPKNLLQMNIKKWTFYGVAFAVTILPYLLVCAPFIVTHLVPAALLFCPQVIVMVCMALLVFRFVAVDEHGKSLFWGLLLAPVGKGTCQAVSAAEKSGGIMVLPLLIGLNIACELLFLEATYFYAGDGSWESYIESMKTAWFERRTDVYIIAFHSRILGAFWATADFVHSLF